MEELLKLSSDDSTSAFTVLAEAEKMQQKVEAEANNVE